MFAIFHIERVFIKGLYIGFLLGIPQMQTTDYKHNVINLQMHFYQHTLIIEKAGHMHMQSRVC